MSVYERILVPIDFSVHSTEAMRVAADLAHRFDAGLTLTYVNESITARSRKGARAVRASNRGRCCCADRSDALESSCRQACSTCCASGAQSEPGPSR